MELTVAITTLFVDTNVFIQLRDLKDLPWRSLFPEGERIDIIITPRVIEELDKFKISTNGRKRDRARLALKLIEQASTADTLTLTIRASPIAVRIVIADAPPLDWSQLPKLDAAKPDDHLVAEALAFGDGAAVFSHDTGPRIRARLAKVEAIEPPEDWHLPAETTDEQRKIAHLERDLERARNTFPKIVAGFGVAEAQVTSVSFDVPVLAPLNENAVDALTQIYLSRNPRDLLNGSPSSILHGFAFGHSEQEVESYNRKYEEFRRSVRAHFVDLHKKIAYRALAGRIVYFISNDSGIAASGLRVDTHLSGNASLFSEGSKMTPLISLNPPQPPEPPRSLHDMMSRPLVDITTINTLQSSMQPRDPTGFYWFSRPLPGSKDSALQCEDFRATRKWTGDIWIWVTGALPFSGEVVLTVSASNLPAPITATATLVMRQSTATWTNRDVLAMLPEWMQSGVSTQDEVQ